jgi:hypothetical protein
MKKIKKEDMKSLPVSHSTDTWRIDPALLRPEYKKIKLKFITRIIFKFLLILV